MKRRPRGTVLLIFAIVALVLAATATMVWLRRGGERRVVGGDRYGESASPAAANSGAPASETRPVLLPAQASAAVPASDPSLLLTVSGYIINRERIEVSPRFQGVVNWVGVRKGDRVTKGQIVVRLDDAEQRARVAEAEGRLESARTALARAGLAERRTRALSQSGAVSAEALDEAELSLRAGKALVSECEGLLSLAQTYLDWTVIRSPIDGVVLEKLVEPGELVAPMSFGGPRGPSTALLAVADPGDLQVELDIGEADLAKVRQGGRCRVTPEAYPDKHYEAVVAEIAPEANRQKGTLQVRVQVLQPDSGLTPELSAKVEFLRPGS